jgi:hypothetical protein
MKTEEEISRNFFEHLKERGLKIVEIDPIESKPEFKVGDWVSVKPSEGISIKRISKVINPEIGWFESEEGNIILPLTCIYLATKDEIEFHLKKEAKRRGLIGKGLRLKDAHDGYIGISSDCYYEYRPQYDSLVVASKGDYAVTNLYYKGKWAEIIPEKKKFPKTKKELMEVVADFQKWYEGGAPSNFWDCYED